MIPFKGPVALIAREVRWHHYWPQVSVPTKAWHGDGAEQIHVGFRNVVGYLRILQSDNEIRIVIDDSM